MEQTIASSVIEADQEASQSQIVISSENDLPGNYKLVMVTASNDNSTEEYMFSQSGTCKNNDLAAENGLYFSKLTFLSHI